MRQRWPSARIGASADTSPAFAAMALLAVISVGLFYGLAYLERKVLPYA